MSNNFYKFAIIGNPLAHSISPDIQIAALKSLNMQGSYEKFEITSENIKAQIDYFIKNKFSGFNVTIPHKVEILKYLDEIDSTTNKIGAVNTVKIDASGKLIGYNTDIYGFIEPIKNIEFENATVIGAGGAALAVICGLDMLGCKNINLYARDINKAQNLANKLSSNITAKINPLDLKNLVNLKNTDILVNATPLGTKGTNENAIAINEELLSDAKNNIVIYDLVYNPQETKLIKEAKKYSYKTINGLQMLIYQGAKAFCIWTGQMPDIRQMENAAIKTLK